LSACCAHVETVEEVDPAHASVSDGESVRVRVRPKVAGNTRPLSRSTTPVCAGCYPHSGIQIRSKNDTRRCLKDLDVRTSIPAAPAPTAAPSIPTMTRTPEMMFAPPFLPSWKTEAWRGCLTETTARESAADTPSLCGGHVGRKFGGHADIGFQGFEQVDDRFKNKCCCCYIRAKNRESEEACESEEWAIHILFFYFNISIFSSDDLKYLNGIS